MTMLGELDLPPLDNPTSFDVESLFSDYLGTLESGMDPKLQSGIATPPMAAATTTKMDFGLTDAPGGSTVSVDSVLDTNGQAVIPDANGLSFNTSPDGVYQFDAPPSKPMQLKAEKGSPNSAAQTVPVAYVTLTDPATQKQQVVAQPLSQLSVPLARFVEMQHTAAAKSTTRQAKPRKTTASAKRLQQNRAAQQRHRERKRQDVEALQQKAEALTIRERELDESRKQNEALLADKKLLEEELARKDREILALMQQNSELRGEHGNSPVRHGSPASTASLDVDEEEEKDRCRALHAEYRASVEQLKDRVDNGAKCSELKETVARCHEIVAELISHFGPFERPCSDAKPENDLMVMEGGGEMTCFEGLKKLECDRQRWIEITKSLSLSDEEVNKIFENRDHLLKSMKPIYNERRLLNEKVKTLMKENLFDQNVTTHQAAKRSHESESKVVKVLEALRRNLISEQYLRQEFQRQFFDKISCTHTAQIIIESYPLPVNAMAVTNTIYKMRTGESHH